MDGVTVKLASMTWAQAEKFVEQGREMLARDPKPADSEWVDRTLDTIVISVRNAGQQSDFSVEGKDGLKELFDMPTINAMFLKVLEISGLRTTGEVRAA